MSKVYWRTTEPPDPFTGLDGDHEVDEDHALPVGIYWTHAEGTSAEAVSPGHPLPVQLPEALSPIHFASRVEMTCAAAGDYAAGDVLSNSATDGVGRSIYVPSLTRLAGGTPIVMNVVATCNEDAVAFSLRLHFFRVSPVAADVEMDDNVPFDAAKLVGAVDNWAGSILLNAFVDRGTSIATSETFDIRQIFRCAPHDNGLWMVVTAETGEANETAAMRLAFDFYVL